MEEDFYLNYCIDQWNHIKNIGFWYHMGDMGGLNRAKYSYEVPEWFADQPGHPRDEWILAMLLYYYNIKPILTKQRFRRKRARHEVVFKSAMGKMTGGSVGSFHVLSEKGGLLSQEPIYHFMCFVNKVVYYSDLHFWRGPMICRFTF